MSTITAHQPDCGTINQARGDQFNNTGGGDIYYAQSMNFAAPGGQDGPSLTHCLAALFETLRSDPRDDRASITQRKGTRVDGTCKWIKSDTLYQSWIQSESSYLLWISGGPGKGKTMLSIFLAEEIEQIVELGAGDAGFLELFCDNKDDKRNKAEIIIRGLNISIRNITWWE